MSDDRKTMNGELKWMWNETAVVYWKLQSKNSHGGGEMFRTVHLVNGQRSVTSITARWSVRDQIVTYLGAIESGHKAGL
jgi:hypothetical protein